MKENADPKVSRRTALKGLAGTATVGATGAAAHGPVGDADAIACGGVCLGAIAIAGGAAVGYAAHEVQDHYMGNHGELSGTEETDDLHRELRTRLIETYGANDSVLTTLQNRITDARNVVWPDAKKEAVKVLNNGESESAAKSAATAVVDEHYAVIQKNLLNRGVEWLNTLQNQFDLHESDSTLSSNPVIRYAITYDTHSNDGTIPPADWSEASRTVNLVNGNSYTYTALTATTKPDGNDAYDPRTVSLDPTGISDSGNSSSGTITGHYSEVDPVDSGEIVPWVNKGLWSNVWTAAQDDHSQMVSNVNTFVTNLYQTTTAGEIDPSNWMSGTTLASELSTDYETTGHYAYAAAEAAVAGIPGNMENAMRITLEDAGITVSGTIWSEWQPAASSSTSTTTETSTSTETSTTTETTGDNLSSATDAFKVGTTYDPADTNKLVLISYEYAGEAWIPVSDVWVRANDGSWTKDTSVSGADGWTSLEGEKVQVGYGELTQPFTISSATNTETGESLSVVSTESKNHQTADVSVTEEEMQQLLTLAEEMRSNDQPGGGGGFDTSEFSLFGVPGVAVLGGGATLAAGFIAWAGSR